MKETPSFYLFNNKKIGKLLDNSKHKLYPINYYNVINGKGIRFKECSYFVYIYEGKAKLKTNTNLIAILEETMCFTAYGKISLKGKYKAIIIEVVNKGNYIKTNYKTFNTIIDKLEDKGRLNYIDGCSDSILIQPVRKGDPCLNYLHFPANITQTPHTHPSDRIGIVAKGSGECVTPFGNTPLNKNDIFIIREYDGISKSKGLDGNIYENGTHKFNTYNEKMDVIAFHPDSDFGAENTNHPMINRTIVNGISANQIDIIRTK